MAKLKLSKGYEALIDDIDYERLSVFKWHAWKNGGLIYAVRYMRGMVVRSDGRVTTRPRMPLGNDVLKLPYDVLVDHINGDSLNCYSYNLRAVTKQQNNMNMRKGVGRSSRYKGVYFQKREGKWKAHISYNYRTYHVGTYACEEDAARAYDAEARKLFGEYGRYNFPKQGEQSALD